jgi:hypothetical protein
MGCLIMSEGWGWHGQAKSLGRLGRKLDGCPRRHGSSHEVPSWCLPTLLPRFATPATAHGVKRLGNRIDDREDRANCVHVRGTHRNGSCFCHHETPARMKATAGD